MIIPLLKSDVRKMRKSAWLFVMIAPLGVIGMQAANYAMRFEYLTSLHPDKLLFLVMNVHAFWPPAFVLEITLLISLLASVEHHTNMWRKLFSLPVGRSSVYQSKIILILFMLTLSTLILIGGTIILGKLLGFTDIVPIRETCMMAFYTLLATMPFLFVQFFLSMNYPNQGIALTVGIATAIFTMYAHDLPNWAPWKWPLLLEGFENSFVNGLYGLSVGLFLYLFSIIALTKRGVM